jgi:hypothetical protein
MELHASRNRNLPETFHVSFCEDAMGRAAKVRHLGALSKLTERNPARRPARCNGRPSDRPPVTPGLSHEP